MKRPASYAEWLTSSWVQLHCDLEVLSHLRPWDVALCHETLGLMFVCNDDRERVLKRLKCFKKSVRSESVICSVTTLQRLYANETPDSTIQSFTKDVPPLAPPIGIGEDWNHVVMDSAGPLSTKDLVGDLDPMSSITVHCSGSWNADTQCVGALPGTYEFNPDKWVSGSFGVQPTFKPVPMPRSRSQARRFHDQVRIDGAGRRR